MYSLPNAAVVVAFALLTTPAKSDADAQAALALAKAKAVAVKRIAANAPLPQPEKCDGTCCDDLDTARKNATTRKLPIVLFVGCNPKPADVKALDGKAVLCKVREYDVDLDPRDIDVYKATPRVWLMSLRPDAAAFELSVRWAPDLFTPEKANAALSRPASK